MSVKIKMDCNLIDLQSIHFINCGGRGIRTPGPTFGRSTVFETAPFDRSGIPPIGCKDTNLSHSIALILNKIYVSLQNNQQ